MLKTNRRFGIEFEFNWNWEKLDSVAKRIIASICGKNSYVSRNEKYSVIKELGKWHIKRENDVLGEINTPVSKVKDLPEIAKVIETLAKKKVSTNKECGLHIHIEVKDIDKHCIIARWLQCEKGILDCFPTIRRKTLSVEKLIRNRLDSKKFVSEVLEYNTNRASHGDIISLRDYDERKTIEIRVAEGTTDSKLVVNWVRFLLYWFEHLKTLKPILLPCKQCNSLGMDKILEQIGADDETKDFMLWRYEKYRYLPYWVK